MNNLYNNRGYTLLFASITAGLVLGVAVFILSVSRRQAIIAALAKNSTYSMYAADSAIECVSLRRNDLNAVDGIEYTDADTMSSTTIKNGLFSFKCNIEVFMELVTTPSGYSPLDSTFGPIQQAQGYMDTGNKTCAVITVTTGATADPYDLADNEDTNNLKKNKIFDASGFNLCESNTVSIGGNPVTVMKPVYSSPSLVERALRLTVKGSW